MQSQSLARWQHYHDFLGAKHGIHERRTWAVVALTTVMMITEIGGVTLFGSMALVAREGSPAATPAPLDDVVVGDGEIEEVLIAASSPLHRVQDVQLHQRRRGQR